jgi:hypothetical protein
MLTSRVVIVVTLLSALTNPAAAIGKCQVCIRQSFLLAAVSWILVLILFEFTQPKFAMCLLVVALALTSLWGGHIVAFLLRTRLPRDDYFVASRRAGFVLLGRGLAAAALILPNTRFSCSANLLRGLFTENAGQFFWSLKA